MFCSIAHTLLILLFVKLGFTFSNTSPLVIISNQKQLSQPRPENEQDMSFSVTSLLGNLQHSLGCDYDAYVVVSEPGISESSISEETTPKLIELVSKAKDVLQYPSLLQGKQLESGDSAVEELCRLIADKCEAQRISLDSKKGDLTAYEDTTPRVISVDLDSSESLISNDKYLHNVIHKLPSGNFVIVYTGGQASSRKDDENNMQIVAEDDKPFISDDSSLFAKYQYFSPGIFMSTIVPLLMIYILIVALGWLSDLKISFGSFEPKK